MHRNVLSDSRNRLGGEGRGEKRKREDIKTTEVMGNEGGRIKQARNGGEGGN